MRTRCRKWFDAIEGTKNSVSIRNDEWLINWHWRDDKRDGRILRKPRKVGKMKFPIARDIRKDQRNRRETFQAFFAGDGRKREIAFIHVIFALTILHLINKMPCFFSYLTASHGIVTQWEIHFASEKEKRRESTKLGRAFPRVIARRFFRKWQFERRRGNFCMQTWPVGYSTFPWNRWWA